MELRNNGMTSDEHTLQFAAYFALIEDCRLREEAAKKGYMENHHIKPKAWGGDRSKANMIRLSYRDHCRAHYLLARDAMGEERHGMITALVKMLGIKTKGELPVWNEEEIVAVSLMRDEYIARRSEIAKIQWKEPEFRTRKTKQLREMWSDPALKAKHKANSAGKMTRETKNQAQRTRRERKTISSNAICLDTGIVYSSFDLAAKRGHFAGDASVSSELRRLLHEKGEYREYTDWNGNTWRLAKPTENLAVAPERDGIPFMVICSETKELYPSAAQALMAGAMTYTFKGNVSPRRMEKARAKLRAAYAAGDKEAAMIDERGLHWRLYSGAEGFEPPRNFHSC